jgi:ATP-binding cassette subfamily B multidrug efflux pump
VMESGSIVEQGSHDELLAAKGAYWRLYNAQFEGAAEDEELVPVPAVPLAPPPTTAQIVVEALAESEDVVE